MLHRPAAALLPSAPRPQHGFHLLQTAGHRKGHVLEHILKRLPACVQKTGSLATSNPNHVYSFVPSGSNAAAGWTGAAGSPCAHQHSDPCTAHCLAWLVLAFISSGCCNHASVYPDDAVQSVSSPSLTLVKRPDAVRTPAPVASTTVDQCSERCRAQVPPRKLCR